MSKKDLELLKEDLASRLPHGVKCLVEIDETEYDEFSGKDIGFKGKSIGELYLLDMNDNHVELYFDEKNNISDELSDMSMEGLITVNDIKPYLRSMSSMTEEELYIIESNWAQLKDGNWLYECVDEITTLLNSHHLDYRDLITKGLALEAPEGMYN